MAVDLNLGEVFGFGNINLGGMGAIATIGLVLFISLVIMGLLGWLVWIIIRKRLYNKSIHVWRRVGNQATRVGHFRARSLPVGRAGDQLWFVSKVKKYLPPGTIQSAPNEYWFWIREDGEWINFGMDDLDEQQKKSGVKYIHQDMRMQRLATDRLLEQRLMQKSFWDKWGTTLTLVIYFLVIAVSLTIFMYMFGKNIDKMNVYANNIAELEATCRGEEAPDSLIPVALFFLVPVRLWKKLWRRKWQTLSHYSHQ